MSAATAASTVIPLAMSAMQTANAHSSAADTAVLAEQQAQIARAQAESKAETLREQNESNKRQARSQFLRSQAQRRVQGASSGAGASSEVLAGAAADSEREQLAMDQDTDTAVESIMAGADLADYQAKARASQAKREANRSMTGSLLGMGQNLLSLKDTVMDL